MTEMKLRALLFPVLFFLFLFVACSVHANEVDKGKIPSEHLSPSTKTLPWNVAVWDVEEAITHLKKGKNILWVDTRPESFFKKGTIRDAVLLIYNKQGFDENTLNKESLAKALADKGIDADSATIVFFCQGPKCHRSYNAGWQAVTNWGYKPEQIVWFRSGYPLLLKKVKESPKLKRKAKRYISDAGLKSL